MKHIVDAISRVAISALLIAGLLPLTALAQEERGDTAIATRWFQLDNPLYGGAGEFVEVDPPSADTPVLLSSDEVSYVTYDEAVVAIADGMTDRESSISVSLETDAGYEPLAKSMFYDALEEDGNPLHGDYLRWMWDSMSCSMDGYISGSTGAYYITYTYSIVYKTTAAQESVLISEVEDVLDGLGIDGKSNYQKASAIYDYICSNVTYDNENLEDETYRLKYTAYAALMDGTSVCQGYSSLFYLMASKAGLSTRIISGTGNGGAHSWNIVQLDDGLYYDIDATWDASRKQAGYDYAYFLKSDADFEGHVRGASGGSVPLDYASDDFYEAYPMAEISYQPSFAINGSTGESYATLSEALAAAEDGETVRLIADVSEGPVQISPGVTLDLNGCELTAGYVVGFGEGAVVDGSGGEGLLKVARDRVVLDESNGQLPVWNGEGYVLTDVSFNQRIENASEDGTTFRFKPVVNTAAKALLLDGLEDNGVSVKVRMMWTTSGGSVVSQDFTYSDDVAKNVFKSGTLTLSVTGIENIDDLGITAMVVSDKKATALSKTLDAKVNGE